MRRCCLAPHPRFSLSLRLFLDFAFDGLPCGSVFNLGRWVALFLDGFLEAFHGATQVTANIAQLLGAEHHQNNNQTISQCQMLNEPIFSLQSYNWE